jgi:hypothetical protein
MMGKDRESLERIGVSLNWAFCGERSMVESCIVLRWMESWEWGMTRDESRFEEREGEVM